MKADKSGHKYDKVVPPLNYRNKLFVPYKDNELFGKSLY